MSVIKRYKILDSLPTYGPIYIPVSEDNRSFYSEGFVVRFYKSDGTDWVANFKSGLTEFNDIIEINDTSKLIVIAGGACYIMNPEQSKPLSFFDLGYVSAMKAEDGRLILEGQTKLTIIETDGEHWNSERISWDGLKDSNLENNLVKGFSYDPMYDSDEWIEFTYNIDTKVLTGGSFNRYEATKKPWWKIW